MKKLCPVATSKSSLMVLMDTYTTRMNGWDAKLHEAAATKTRHHRADYHYRPCRDISSITLLYQVMVNWGFTVTCFVL